MQNQYELMLILKPQAAEEDEKKVTKRITEFLKDKGKIITSASLGKKQLAFPIKKENSGVYLLLNVELEGKEVVGLSDKLKLEQAILRHLFIKKE
jgi:small subunit ribosomal protein S6